MDGKLDGYKEKCFSQRWPRRKVAGVQRCWLDRQRAREEIIMPLVKSKSPEAFRKNVKAEVAAGKPVKQAVAIAYSVKREAQKTPAKKK
jgi:hypothetical protein